MTDKTPSDELTAGNEAARVTGLGYPVFKKDEDGALEVYDVVTVASYRQIPDGRWNVYHGRLSRCASEDVWLWEPVGEKEWAEFDRRTTFHSLDAAVKAAKARQQQVQAEYDAKEGT